MPSLTKKVSNQLRARIESAKTKTVSGTKPENIKAKLEALKQKAKTNIANERANASQRAKTALPESHKFVSRNMAQLSKQAARNRPMTLNPHPMSDIENMIFHSEQMQSPYIHNIESVTIGDSRNATDQTLANIERETLGLNTPVTQKRKNGKFVKGKRKQDWQDTITDL